MSEVDKKYLFASLSVFTLFLFIVSAVVIYIQENYSVTNNCGCQVSIYWIIVALASLGLFSGSLTYYFHSKTTEKEIVHTNEKVKKTLDFLDNEEKIIIQHLIGKKGVDSQSNIASKINISNVKLHRRIKKLEYKGLVYKENKGMSNKIFLNEDLKEVFIK